MSYSRYSIEKKQESNDRGVTWHDVTPLETRLGVLQGITRTIAECQDLDCDLERYLYYVADGSFPEEICGVSLPYGIANTIKFTYGAQCCDTWYGQNVSADSPFGIRYSLNFGKAGCYDSGFQVCWNYASNTVSGSQVNNACMSVCNWPAVCSCFMVTQFMPWAEGKTEWKVLYKQHQIRRHCSDEWEDDGEAVLGNIAERWFPTAGADEISWQHQIAVDYDENQDDIIWEDEGEPIIQKLGHDLPDGYTYYDGLTLDTCDYSQLSFAARNKDDIYFEIKGSIDECGRFVHSSLEDRSVWDYYAFNLSGGVCSNTTAINDNCGGYGGYSMHQPNFGVFSLACINSSSFKRVEIGLISDYSVWKDTTVNVFSRKTTSIKSILVTSEGQLTSRLIPVMYGNTKKMFDSMSGRIYSLVPPTGYTSDVKFSADYNDGTTYTAYYDGLDSLSQGLVRLYSTSYKSMTSAEIGTRVRTIGASAMTDCVSLTSVTIPNTITTIGSRAFYGCTKLRSLTIPSSVTLIKSGAFVNCGFWDFTIPNNVTTLEYSVFTGCTSLTSCTIGNGVTSIGSYLFDACTSLQSVTVLATTPPALGNDVFRNSNNCTIYVPNSSLTAYKTADGWKNYLSRIQPIP